MTTPGKNDTTNDENPPIDSRGIPTTYLSYLILDLMFTERNRWFTADHLAKIMAATIQDTKLICDGLLQADFLTEDQQKPGSYKYNLNCQDAERQARLEKFLLETELECLQVHTILPYSPSFP